MPARPNTVADFELPFARMHSDDVAYDLVSRDLWKTSIETLVLDENIASGEIIVSITHYHTMVSRTHLPQTPQANTLTTIW